VVQVGCDCKSRALLNTILADGAEPSSCHSESANQRRTVAIVVVFQSNDSLRTDCLILGKVRNQELAAIVLICEFNRASVARKVPSLILE